MAIYGVAFATLVWGYYADRSTCVWRAVTGIPCPGCGMMHAFLALARGDVRAAWALNPASLIALPVLLWNGLRETMEMMQ